MRPLEALLLIANLLAFVGLLAPRLRAARWVRGAGIAAPVAAGAQVLVEGQRWQMVPAYALSVALFIAWVLQASQTPRTVRQASRLTRLATAAGAAAGLLGLAVSSALPIILPVFRFREPSGPYGIGTLTYHWVDPTRVEFFTADPNDRREVVVQVWYPAMPSPSAPRAPYLPNPEVLAPAARFFHVPDFFFDHLKYVTTHATPFAPVADGESSYPVLVFLSGRAGYRQVNTFQVEELVSHGYIVAGVDQPYAAAGVRFPDGRVAALDPRMFGPPTPGHPAFFDNGVIPFLAQDVAYALDQLAALNQADPNSLLTGRLDLGRPGLFGVSLGGTVGSEACRLEPRLRACLLMDAYMPADVVRSGLQQPAMWISRDARTMQLEGWNQADIDETQDTMRAVYEGLPGDGYLVLIPGIFHAQFTDSPLLSPFASLLGLSGPFDAQRAHCIINAYTLALFDRHVRGEPAALLDGPSDQYSEVLFESRRVSQ